MRRQDDNVVLRWLVYQVAWWIVKRQAQIYRRKAIAAGVIAAVVAGGAAIAVRSRSN